MRLDRRRDCPRSSVRRQLRSTPAASVRSMVQNERYLVAGASGCSKSHLKARLLFDTRLRNSSCVTGLHVETLTYGCKCRLDLLQARVMPKRKQPFYMGPRNPDPPRKFRFLQAGF
jgi:hypothetical protein